jgi:hypothetical protein
MSRGRVISLERALPKFLASRHGQLRARITEEIMLLTSIVRFGDPKPDEPLSEALQRAVVNAVPRSKLDAHMRFNRHLSREQCALSLLRRESEIGRALYGERSWLQGLIDSVPAWLLAFVDADRTTKYLGLELPAGVNGHIPGRVAFEKRPPWPELPMGAFFEGGAMTRSEYRAARRREAQLNQVEELPLTRRERRLRRQQASEQAEWSPFRLLVTEVQHDGAG